MPEKLVAKTISAFDFTGRFPTELDARKYLEGLRWKNGVVCPHCEEKGSEATVKGREGYYQCRACRKVYTVRVGTIFHRSKISLKNWLSALYLLQTSKKGISSLQLSKEIGITQKSAWFLLQRLREACNSEELALKGITAVDETFPEGKEQNKHFSKRGSQGGNTSGKQTVLSLRDRKRRMKIKTIAYTSKPTLQKESELVT